MSYNKPDLQATIEKFTGQSVVKSTASIRCPFHDDKSPSLHIYPDQHWHCFGCSLHGDVYDFIGYLTYKDSWNARDAEMFKSVLKKLNCESIPVRNIRYSEKEELPEPNESMIEAMSWAARAFNRFLTRSNEAQKYRDYLTARGFTQKTIADLEIGCADNRTLAVALTGSKPEDKERLIQSLRKLGMISSEPNRPEFYRERIIFPNADEHGYVYSLTGRDINPKPQIRYLNLSGLKKHIYLIRLTNPQIPLYLTESVSDAVTMRQIGLQAAAVTGTNMSVSMAEELKPFKTIYIVPQNDEPSKNATIKWCEMIRRAKVFRLKYDKGEKDVNDLLTHEGLNMLKYKFRMADKIDIHEYVN